MINYHLRQHATKPTWTMNSKEQSMVPASESTWLPEKLMETKMLDSCMAREMEHPMIWILVLSLPQVKVIRQENKVTEMKIYDF